MTIEIKTLKSTSQSYTTPNLKILLVKFTPQNKSPSQALRTFKDRAESRITFSGNIVFYRKKKCLYVEYNPQTLSNGIKITPDYIKRSINTLGSSFLFVQVGSTQADDDFTIVKVLPHTHAQCQHLTRAANTLKTMLRHLGDVRVRLSKNDPTITLRYKTEKRTEIEKIVVLTSTATNPQIHSPSSLTTAAYTSTPPPHTSTFFTPSLVSTNSHPLFTQIKPRIAKHGLVHIPITVVRHYTSEETALSQLRKTIQGYSSKSKHATDIIQHSRRTFTLVIPKKHCDNFMLSLKTLIAFRSASNARKRPFGILGCHASLSASTAVKRQTLPESKTGPSLCCNTGSGSPPPADDLLAELFFTTPDPSKPALLKFF